MHLRPLTALLFAALAAGLPASAQQLPLLSDQLPSYSPTEPPHVKLCMHGCKTVYNTSELIQLDIMFTAANDSESTYLTIYGGYDKITLQRTDGPNAWPAPKELDVHVGDDSLQDAVTPSHPLVATVSLNELYTFTPGEYTVHVVTERTGKPLGMNDVSFKVVSISEQEEAALATSLEDTIRTSTGYGAYSMVGTAIDRLNLLQGDTATRAKLYLFLNHWPLDNTVARPDLGTAGNRALVVQELEKAIVDPAQPWGASQNVLSELVALKANLNVPNSPIHANNNFTILQQLERPTPGQKSEGERRFEANQLYVHRIAGTLNQRTGLSQFVAADTVFHELADGKKTDDPDFVLARTLLIADRQYASSYSLGWDLDQYSQYLQPSDANTLVRFVLDSSDASTGDRASALKVMTQVAPGDLPRYLGREACSATPVRMMDLPKVQMQTLPGVDDCLSRKMTEELSPGQNRDIQLQLMYTLQYIARFATSALLQQMRTAYDAGLLHDRHQQGEESAALIYLMRWDPDASTPLLKAATANDNIYSVFAAFSCCAYEPLDGMRRYVHSELNEPPGPASGFVAYYLSVIGNVGDRKLLRARLHCLQSEERAQLATSEYAGQLERNLIHAIIQGPNWSSTPQEARALARTCISERCRTDLQMQEIAK